MSTGARFGLGADHPALAGHFPGDPLVPGVLILDAALRATGTDRRGVAIATARFTVPLRPGETLALAWHEAAPGTLVVTGRIGEAAAFGARIRRPVPRA